MAWQPKNQAGQRKTSRYPSVGPHQLLNNGQGSDGRPGTVPDGQRLRTLSLLHPYSSAGVLRRQRNQVDRVRWDDKEIHCCRGQQNSADGYRRSADRCRSSPPATSKSGQGLQLIHLRSLGSHGG